MAAQVGPLITTLMNMGKGIASGAKALPGLIKKYPKTSAATGLVGGTSLYGLMSPDEEQQALVASPRGGGIGDPRNRIAIADPDNFRSTMPLRSEVLQEQYDRNIKRIQNIRLRSAILKAHNPQSKDNYEKGSLDALQLQMEAEGDIRNAKLVESIRNKNGSLPDNSKVIFDRLIKSGADVNFAAAVSGFQSNIEESQARQVKAVMENQLDEREASDKDVIVSRAVRKYNSGNANQVEEAIKDITRLILRNEIDISGSYGYGDKTRGAGEARRIAMEILAGAPVGSQITSQSSSPLSDEITNLERISTSPE
tara:strand:- start:5185 stop:6117 length:933 start_codon:yes stop_codon:yes gene_type:complete